MLREIEYSELMRYDLEHVKKHRYIENTYFVASPMFHVKH